MALVVKNSPANAGDGRDLVWVTGSGRCPGGGHSNPLQSSYLENPPRQRSPGEFVDISKGNSQAMAGWMILEPRRRVQTRVIDVRVSYITVRIEDGQGDVAAKETITRNKRRSTRTGPQRRSTGEDKQDNGRRIEIVSWASQRSQSKRVISWRSMWSTMSNTPGSEEAEKGWEKAVELWRSDSGALGKQGYCCSITKSCPTLCNPMDCSTSGLPVPHHLPEFAQVHVYWMSDAIQPSHPLLPSSPALNLSQHQGLFQWVISPHHMAQYWNFSFSICPSSEYSELTSFKIDWFDLLTVQGTLRCLLQHHSLKASVLWQGSNFENLTPLKALQSFRQWLESFPEAGTEGKGLKKGCLNE